MAVTTGMVGHGFYDLHSAPQWAAIEAVLPWLEDAVAAMDLHASTQPAVMADFGCAEGQNSIQMTRRLISALRRQSPHDVLTIHSDLPTNDYGSLLRSLRSGDRSTFGDGVFSAVVPGSMFDRLLPRNSCHVVTTYNAIGFLSRRPVDRLPDYILPNGPSAQRGVGSVSSEDRARFAAQAVADVETFLRARAAELVPGGKLLLQVFGSGPTGRTCDGIYDALNDALLEALDAGLIDRSSYEAYYQPVYFRTLDELTAPIEAPNGLLAPFYRLDQAATYEVEIPFVEDFRRDGDAATFARSYTNFFRAFCEAVLCAAFPRSDPAKFADDIFARAERLIAKHPERYEFHYVSVAALMTRLDHAVE